MYGYGPGARPYFSARPVGHRRYPPMDFWYDDGYDDYFSWMEEDDWVQRESLAAALRIMRTVGGMRNLTRTRQRAILIPILREDLEALTTTQISVLADRLLDSANRMDDENGELLQRLAERGESRESRSRGVRQSRSVLTTTTTTTTTTTVTQEQRNSFAQRYLQDLNEKDPNMDVVQASKVVQAIKNGQHDEAAERFVQQQEEPSAHVAATTPHPPPPAYALHQQMQVYQPPPQTPAPTSMQPQAMSMQAPHMYQPPQQQSLAPQMQVSSPSPHAGGGTQQMYMEQTKYYMNSSGTPAPAFQGGLGQMAPQQQYSQPQQHQQRPQYISQPQQQQYLPAPPQQAQTTYPYQQHQHCLPAPSHQAQFTRPNPQLQQQQPMLIGSEKQIAEPMSAPQAKGAPVWQRQPQQMQMPMSSMPPAMQASPGTPHPVGSSSALPARKSKVKRERRAKRT